MSARRKRRGRPPKAISDARPHMLMIRLHTEEWRALAAAAARAGKPLATHVREVALAAETRKRLAGLFASLCRTIPENARMMWEPTGKSNQAPQDGPEGANRVGTLTLTSLCAAPGVPLPRRLKPRGACLVTSVIAGEHVPEMLADWIVAAFEAEMERVAGPAEVEMEPEYDR